jgi:hypothetical protein
MHTTSIGTSTTASQSSSTVTSSYHPSSTGTFSYDSKNFYVDGKAFQIIGGQIDPQRVPKEYWAQRIQMAKSMGLNTIFSYLFWHYIEPTPGNFNFTSINDLATFYQTVQEAGMMAVLRPGPYVTAERDWGGLPGWLSQIPNMKTRSNNAPFLTRTAMYLTAVGEQIRPYLVSNGGPIMMAQIENEYGYVGSDYNYKEALSNQMASAFPNTRQYTNDGNSASALQGGSLPGALCVVDGTDPQSGFPLRNQAITTQSELGPLMDGEYWVTWFDAWGSKNGHAGYNYGAGTLEWILSGGNHFSIYMFHGGGSFPFGNGAGGSNPLQPFTTSYDYGAPLDESGRPAPIYSSFRSACVQHNPGAPAVPSLPPLQSIAPFALTPVAGLFDTLPSPITASSPQVMEALGQCFGYILYEYVATSSASGQISVGSGAPRDRVLIYVNGVRKGVLDAIYNNRPAVHISLNQGDKLWLFVENLGRVKDGISDQRKGIVGSVVVGSSTLSGPWNHYLFPFEVEPSIPAGSAKAVTSDTQAPVWYHGTFTNTQAPGMAADTFLSLPGGTKGLVFVNGRNIGRYWTVGPQQQLWVPGAWLNQGANQIFVLELEPTTSSRVAQGLATRTWGNNPDPDCNNCT